MKRFQRNKSKKKTRKNRWGGANEMSSYKRRQDLDAVIFKPLPEDFYFGKQLTQSAYMDGILKYVTMDTPTSAEAEEKGITYDHWWKIIYNNDTKVWDMLWRLPELEPTFDELEPTKRNQEERETEMTFSELKQKKMDEIQQEKEKKAKKKEKQRAKKKNEKMEKNKVEGPEKERLEKERIKKERIENERLEKERIENERIEYERIKNERIENERIEYERIENERIVNERIKKEKQRTKKKEKKGKQIRDNIRELLSKHEPQGKCKYKYDRKREEIKAYSELQTLNEKIRKTEEHISNMLSKTTLPDKSQNISLSLPSSPSYEPTTDKVDPSKWL